MKGKKIKIGGVTLDYSFYDGNDIYSEGVDEETLVLETFKNHVDPHSVLQNDVRWPVLYQLSDLRKVITVPMHIERDDVVLEVGAGMGALSGALAKKAKRVDCIDLSERRCLANAYRNENNDNINIYVGNFEKIELQQKYNVIVLVGVLEYASMYIHASKNPFFEFLSRLHMLLLPEGKIYIAIENRLGMKYFAGCCEDHLGKQFLGIEGYSSAKVRTFTKSELEKMLTETGFGSIYFYYPFPDYKLPEIIYSDDMLINSCLPTIWNFDNPRLDLFDEIKAMTSLVGSKEITVFFNSFLIEAVKK